MTAFKLTAATSAVATAVFGTLTAQAQEAPARPRFEADGTVKVPAFDLPPSPFISPQAIEAQKSRARAPGGAPRPAAGIAEMRRANDAALASRVAMARQTYAVDVADQALAGIPVRVITPKGKPIDQDRVLINVHGGGFSMCWESCSILESAPVAALGGFKVISINYRMGPEYNHPAAVEDVEKVYRELLKTLRPQQIGLFGCSAGGALTAQAAAWMPAHKLPQFGAVGIFGAGAVRMLAGDSAYVSGHISGAFPAPPPPGKTNPDITGGYFTGADMGDPIISAALHPDVIAKFPPSLVITGSRAMDMTPAIVTNSALVKAGVPSTLIVQEGMDHCYMYQADLPESRDAHDATVRFFKANLGSAARRR